MFSKELENLIQATLEDGVLEEYEKEALVKRATAEGVDLTELEIYINSILQKRQRELNEAKNAEYAKIEQQKKAAFGKTCPNCGKQVESLTLRCECGYEFKNEKSISSVQKLHDAINNIKFTDKEIQSCSILIAEVSDNETKIAKDENGKAVSKVDSEKLEELRRRKITNLISSFPIPNNKEDIIEFLALSAPKAKLKGGKYWGTKKGRAKCLVIALICVFVLISIISDEELGFSLAGILTFIFAGIGGILIFAIDEDLLKRNEDALVWREKFDQVLMKGRSLRGDAEFQQQLNYYESLLNNK